MYIEELSENKSFFYFQEIFDLYTCFMFLALHYNSSATNRKRKEC